MKLTAKEIQIILEALSEQFGSGYSDNKEVSALQAKLSIMGQMAAGS